MNVQVNVLLDVSPKLEQLLLSLLGQPSPAPAPQTTSPKSPAAPQSKPETPPPAPAEPKPEASAAQAPKPETPVSKTPPASDAPVVTLEALRALASSKGREKVKPLLDECGYTSVTAIPETERAAFKERLEAA